MKNEKKSDLAIKGRKIRLTMLLTTILLSAAALTGCQKEASSAEAKEGSNTEKIELTNVSYDPTRELYERYNEAFAKYWKEKTGQEIEITQSHGGSGKQARSVIEGNEADVVTLALAADITAIQDAGLIKEGWQSKLQDNSAPYTSTIVFLVRKGNPAQISGWQDLIKPDVKVITPNPKTSGGARWNYLAAWAYAEKAYQGDEENVKSFIKKLYDNVLVLDSGARGATTTFVENGQGDVLLAWENEAYLAMKEHPDEYELITPDISIKAEPPVAVVDQTVDERGTRKAAQAYLEYLYSEEGQRIAAENYYRPSDEKVASQYGKQFNLKMNLVTIDDKIFGGWEEVQKKHFDDGGIFDQIYEANYNGDLKRQKTRV